MIKYYKHKFSITLSDNSTIFGTCDASETPEEIRVAIAEIYHELPMEPDKNDVPCASMLTCLNSLIPAIIGCRTPFAELGAMIWIDTITTLFPKEAHNGDPKYH